MSELQKITQEQMDAVGVVSAPDVLSGTPSENKSIFDKMVRQLIAPAYNQAIDAINAIEQTEGGIQAAEAERVEAEQGREEAEEARQQAEAERAEAEENRQNAETGYVQQAADSAELSESWAVGGTGIRTGEDTNNAKYWSQQAQHAAGGGVTSFKNRSGVVVPQEGDYTAYQIKTEDGGNVETALLSKADNENALSDRLVTITGNVLAFALICDPGLYLVDTSATDTPVSGLWYYAKIFDVFGAHRIVELYAGANQGHQEIYYNTYNPTDPAWKGWSLIVTAIPPQEYDIPLAEGWAHTNTMDKNCYCRTQEGVVIVNFSAKYTGGIVPSDSGYILGYLPVGFRPSKAAIGVCGDYNYNGNSIYHFWVNETGAIVIYSPGKVPIAASGTAVFVAEG